MKKIFFTLLLPLMFCSACIGPCDIEWVEPELSAYLYHENNSGEYINLLDNQELYNQEEIQVEFMGKFWKAADDYSSWLHIRSDENGSYLLFMIPGHNQYDDDIIIHWNQNEKDSLHIKRTIKGHKSHNYWSKNGNEFSKDYNASYIFLK